MTADTPAVPDFAAWSRLLRGFADDIADGSGVSPEEIVQVREIADWLGAHDRASAFLAWAVDHERKAEEPDWGESPKRMARRVAIGKAIDDERERRGLPRVWEAKTP